MTNTRQFLEDELLLSIQNRKNMAEGYLQGRVSTTSELKDYWYLQGSIDCLKRILAKDLGQAGFHYYRTGLTIEDVFAVILPRISSHNSDCICHECITNDVLQDFIKHERGLL
jgi:hypothetical protein